MDTHTDPNGPLAFFRAQQRAFTATLDRCGSQPNLLDALLSQAWDSFDGNVGIQGEGERPLACHKGCATCCTVRVTATAPEVLMIARFLRATEPVWRQAGLDLTGSLQAADADTRGLGEEERVKLRRRCAFIAKGVCTIYPVRPLACRGHASHDKQACVEAAAGRAAQVPYSEAHHVVRSLVQNAMQSALRDAGFAWSAYELHHAVRLALDDAGSERGWATGADVLAAAQVHDVSETDMAETFDRLLERAA